jgi:hypothetical protein
LIVKLRDHPLLTRKSGVKNWPPTWSRLVQERSAWPVGEVGTLKNVRKNLEIDRCLFVFIEHNGLEYAAIMYFDEPGFCRDIYRVLTGRIGWLIEEIGDLDLSRTL